MPPSDLPPPPTFISDLTPDHPHAIVAQWQRHVDARRIGAAAPLSPQVVASIRAAEAALGVRTRGGVW